MAVIGTVGVPASMVQDFIAWTSFIVN